MIKNISALFFAILLLSGCAGKCISKHSTQEHANKSNDYYEYDQQIVEFEQKVGDRVFFALNSADLSNKSEKTLKHQAEWLKDHTAFNVNIEGHTDERGTREVNIAVGERRAETVKMFLTKHGVAADRIHTISYGKERPAVVGHDEAAWSQNRRAITAIK